MIRKTSDLHKDLSRLEHPYQDAAEFRLRFEMGVVSLSDANKAGTALEIARRYFVHRSLMQVTRLLVLEIRVARDARDSSYPPKPQM